MMTTGVQDLQFWRLNLIETISGLLGFDSVSELKDLDHPVVMMSEAGYARVTRGRDENPHFAPLDDLDLRQGQKIVLSVDTALCFRRSVDVRSASASTTGKILALDLARIMPSSVGDWLSGYTIFASDPVRKTAKVDHVVLRKAILEPVLAHCARHDCRVAAITFHESTLQPLPIAVDPNGGPFYQRRFERWVTVGVLSLVSLLLSGAAVAWTIAGHTEAARTVIVEETQKLQEKVSDIQQRLDKLKSSSAESASLVNWKRSSPLLPMVLEDLSAILPDDAFLDSLSIDGDIVSLEGLASAPERLIATLEASSRFRDVAFTAPVFRNPSDSKSRFALRLLLETPVSGQDQ